MWRASLLAFVTVSSACGGASGIDADARPADAGHADGPGAVPDARDLSCGECSSIGGACGTDGTCVADIDQQKTFCVSPGTAGANETCDALDACAAGLTCVAGTCRLPCTGGQFDTPTCLAAGPNSYCHPFGDPLPGLCGGYCSAPFPTGDTVAVSTMIGSPTWEIVDWQVFAAPLVDTTLFSIWPDHGWSPIFNVLVPDDPHSPPYTGELPAAVAAAGFDSGQRFARATWAGSDGYGLFFSATIIPTAGAPIGRSPDFDADAIIPNGLFPLAVDGDLYREGLLVDAAFDSAYPALTTTLPGTTAEGYSHVPLNFGENELVCPCSLPAGAYEFRVRVTGTDGAGWSVTIPFTTEDSE